MIVLGIVGSPRKNGRTNSLIDAALAGAESEGAATRKVYLVDYEIKPLTFPDGSDEPHPCCPKELSELCGEAGAIVLGAPVYWGDINGMTKDFMDSVRIAGANGKPALGIAIAGGSGKGLLSGVQSIYHFFFHRQMRGVDPTPVSRFNQDEASEQLKTRGARLAELSREAMPFPGRTQDDRWPDVLAHYASLEYLSADPLDEFVMLAGQLINISEGNRVEQAKSQLDRALALMAEGKRSEAARYAVGSYQVLYFA